MAKYVLISDTTLSNEYRNFPLLDFLSCVPTNLIPQSIYSYLKGRPPPAIQGRASKSPYPLRKIEAALLQEHSENDVVIPHEDYIECFIGKDTEVIGISTMDPFGIGPLTMSFPVFFGLPHSPYVKLEFEALVRRVNKARKGTKAKLVVAGPGVWEAMVFPEELDRLGIDFAFQGEGDDIACVLFKEIAEDSFSNTVFSKGFQTFDAGFHKTWAPHDRFLSRNLFSKQFPTVDEISEIRNPSIKSLIEVMRGCGIGCDFCEVTLRPLRYYPPAKVSREASVNANAGSESAWLQTDEIFAYEHGRNFAPNFDALEDLFSTVMAVKGIKRTNPTHGRISVPAGFPDLIAKLSKIIGAGPSNRIGIQVGLETGSERLAKIHMPSKTLPLRIGSDGGWAQIVWEGTHNLNVNYWRPAFTVQVGQADEVPEDNWETVELINWMSYSEAGGRPFEFSVTPVQNVPLGIMKSKKFSQLTPNESQLAVYYAAYKHLAKVAQRNVTVDNGGNRIRQLGTATILAFGGWFTYRYIKRVCEKRGLDIGKVDRMAMKHSAASIGA
jgi:radical SAM superfamily enzyme YgiQ (UPF0313 family)